MRPQKITFGNMREMGVRGILVYGCPISSRVHLQGLREARPPTQGR
jgi:hypothetical protein